MDGREVFKSYKAIGKLAAVVVLLSVGIYSIISAPSSTNIAPASTTPIPITSTATFTGTLDDGLPVGVWSEEIELGIGCTVSFNAGNGSLYKTQYRFYTQEWIDHEPDSSQKMSHFRFMILSEGVTAVPYLMSCS